MTLKCYNISLCVLQKSFPFYLSSYLKKKGRYFISLFNLAEYHQLCVEHLSFLMCNCYRVYFFKFEITLVKEKPGECQQICPFCVVCYLGYPPTKIIGRGYINLIHIEGTRKREVCSGY